MPDREARGATSRGRRTRTAAFGPPPLTLGVVGAGAIGSFVGRAVRAGQAGSLTLVGMCARPGSAAAASLTRELDVPLYDDPLALGRDADLVLEAASAEVVRTYAIGLLEGGASLMIMSAGALADPVVVQQLELASRVGRARVYLPAGAIGGLDVLRSARVSDLERVALTTSKPPRALRGAPGAPRLGNEHQVVFDGAASQAVAAFPSNVNVAALIGLCSGGMHEVRVRIVADPSLLSNTHRLEASGSFGQLDMTVRNLPSPQNPRTSQLAALSVVAALRQLTAQIVIC